MPEPVELNNTFTEYLGSDFQRKLLWQFLVDPEFAIKIYPDLSVDYFDETYVKKFFVVMSQYIKNFDKAPNLQNNSIRQAITMYKAQGNRIEEEQLFTILKGIEQYNEMIINNPALYDGDIVQRLAYSFIKQQEYRKLGEYILTTVKKRDTKEINNIKNIEDRIQRIALIGEFDDRCEEVFDNIENALRINFRDTIPTGIDVIDALTGGGLGKGEIGLILSPSGVGKTTTLTKIANTAYKLGKNVAQIVFEDTIDQVKRKHYTLFTKTPLSEIDNNLDEVTEKVRTKKKEIRELGGKLIIKAFSQDNTTMVDIKNWIISYQKKYGIVFDLIVLDYLDCVESHRKVTDRNENELVVVKAFEALASELNVPSWSAIQTNRSGFNSELIEANQSGGSIKRIQKSHFFMSVGKSADQKEANLATISILKARFAKDGQTFKDCIFNNDTLEIRIIDEVQKAKAYAKQLKKPEIDKAKHLVEQIEEKKHNHNADIVAKNALDDMRDKFLSKQSEAKEEHENSVVNEEIPVVVETTNVITQLENSESVSNEIAGKLESEVIPETNISTPVPKVTLRHFENMLLSEEDLKNNDDAIERYLRENRKNEENL